MWAKWPGLILKCAGVYNLAWGLWAILMPMAWFDMLSIERPVYPQLWQCIGMIVGVYGIGYLIASTNHARHWPIVLVGLLGKIFGPIGFLSAALRGDLPWRWGWTILTNDLIWWLPFVAILWDAFKENTRPQARHASYDELLAGMVSQRGATLAQLSARHPVLLVFLRHSGCVFCREALVDLATTRSAIEAEGAEIAVAHMSTPMKATQLLTQFGLEDLHRFSDPTCALYHAFGLVRGKPLQLLGPRIWIRGAKLFARGYTVGSIDGDGLQMPGAFVIRGGKIIRSFRHTTAADRPNYLEMVQSAQQELIGSVYDRLQSAS